MDHHRPAARDGARAASCSKRSAPARRRRRSPTSTPLRTSRRRCASSARASPACSGMDVPDAAVERILTSLGFEVSKPTPRPRGHAGWDVIATAVARRHASPGRSDRRSRASPRLRAPADDVPRRRAGAAAVGSAHRARSPRAHGAARHGLLRGDHLRVHRSRDRRAVPRMARRRSHSPIRCRRSSPSCGRACCRVSSTRSATIAGTAAPTSASSRSARASRPAGESRGAAFAWMGLGTADHWSGARRPVDFSDIKGVVEQLAALASGRGRPSREIERAYPRAAAAPRAIMINGHADRRASASSSPAIADARDLPAADEIYVARDQSRRRDARPRRSRRCARRRCRATRPSCATSRFSSTMPCLPKRFVAPFGRPRPTR